MGETMQDCSICWEKITKAPGPADARSLMCAHVFHGSCISAWLKSHNTCPICRRAIYSEPPAGYRAKKTRPGDLRFYRAALDLLDPAETSSDSDEEKSVDYGNESDFERECVWEDGEHLGPFSFRISTTVVVELM